MTGRSRLLVILCVVSVLLFAACVPLPPPASLSDTSAVTAVNATPTLVAPPATPPAAATVVSLAVPQVNESLPSPDGEWRAEVVVYPCVETGEGEQAFEELRLTDAHHGRTFVADHQLQNCGGLGAFGLGRLSWSQNSRYLYYTDAREGVPDGGCGAWIPPTVRLDVETHEVVHLGSGPLSLDKTQLATWQADKLVIWKLETGETIRIRARVADAVWASIAWSPDGASLAYLQTANLCPPVGASHVTLVDPDLNQVALLDAEELGFTGLEWEDGSTLRLMTADGKAWRLDVASRELTPAN
jgi:hypothetical protein